MKLKLIYILSFLISLYSCSNKENQENNSSNTQIGLEVSLHYAKGFKITEFENYNLLEIINPWQGAENIKLEYLLYKSELPSQSVFPEATRIKVPIKKLVCMSTTHIGFVDILDELESIVGLANKDLVYNKNLKKRIEENLILDMGYEKNLNYELLLLTQPDIIMSYSIGSELAGVKSKLKELGLSMVLNAEYLEPHPLGKAEWIKFIAEFYDKQELADSLFNIIDNEYMGLRKLTASQTVQPSVLLGLPWKGTWYISGGESYSAKLISDAGGDFLWKKNDSHEALGLNIETVYNIAGDADIWINSGYANSYSDLLKTDERIAYFKAYNNRKVFNNSNRLSDAGGNDYWESGIVNPHLILKDLINIFHPGIIEDTTFTYYNRLK